jgi:putative aldouronate transport system substrate-binding protein
MAKARLNRRQILAGAGAWSMTALLAACSSAAPPPTPAPQQPAPTSPPAQPTVAPTTAAAQPTSALTPAAAQPTAAPTATPAPVAAAQPTTGPAVELLYYYGTRVELKDLGPVQDAMNKVMKERINATINMQAIDWGAYNDKMNVKNAAGEKYDLAYTASWTNIYLDNVKNGVLLDLTTLLPQLAPKFYASMNHAAWDAAKVKGKIYAGINQQIWASVIGPLCRNDMLQKYGLDLTKVGKFEDLEPWWTAIAKGEAGKVTPLRPQSPWWNTYWNLDTLPGNVYVYMSDTSAKLQSQGTLPEYKTCMEMVRRWYQASFLPKEVIPSSQVDAMERAGKWGSLIHAMKPGIEAEEKAINGFDWTSKILDKGYLTTGSITATLTGVNKKTSSPEACVKYLELVNNDKPFYNLLCKGIEGKHWVWVDQAKQLIGFPPGVTADNSPYNPNDDWEYGNQFNAYYVDPGQMGSWEKTKALNDKATPSPILGFVPDTQPVKNELAAINAANAEFQNLGLGMLDPARALPDQAKKLDSAGYQKVLTEWQKQINDWKASM